YTILTDPEARGDNRTEVNYGHQREPALLLTGLLRAFPATGFDGTGQSDGYVNPQITNTDQDVLRPPSAFSYYPFDWVVGPGNVLGPEFGIYSTVTSLKRANLINNMLRNAVPRNTTNPYGPAPNGTKLDVSAVQAVSDDPDAIASYLDGLLLHGTMSDDMRAGIVDAVS